jgi:hypothetical protein
VMLRSLSGITGGEPLATALGTRASKSGSGLYSRGQTHAHNE